MTQTGIAGQAPIARALRPTLHLNHAARGAPVPREAEPTLPAIIVVPSAPRLFPLGQLMRAPANVRHTRIEDGCEALADDIQAHGLLQSLIGYQMDGRVEIVGGGRRLKSLRIIKARGHIDDAFPVPVLIRGVEEAVELSLAENLQQRTMSPVDEFLAFAKLMERGDTSPAELAKRFGFSARVVRQRLRLAELAPAVLTALAERSITLDAAMAYASSQDPALQVEVFEQQARRGRTAHDPAGIRHALRMKGIDTADRLYRFVGADRYEREGGGYEDDLFAETGQERVLSHPFLLQTIAERMIEFRAMRLVAALQRDEAWSPTIVGHVPTADLALYGFGTAKPMRPPAGFALVERAEGDRLWRTIRNNGLTAHVVVGIDEAGALIADRRYAFVPLSQKAAVEKPSLADAVVDRDRTALATREREVIRWSRRLAVPPFAGTALEGRVFWPDAAHDQQVRQTVGGVPGFLIAMLVFVPDTAIAAQRAAATAHVDAQAARGEGA